MQKRKRLLTLAAGLGLLLGPLPAPLAGEGSPPNELDFQRACGISPDKLEKLVDEICQQDGLPRIPLMMTLHNAQGDCLVQSQVTVVWKGGTQTVAVPQSGLIVFPLDKSRLEGLKIRAPAGFDRLKQMTFPEGPAFQPPLKLEGFGGHVWNDAEVKSNIRRQLVKIRREGKATSADTLRKQLRRTRRPMKLPQPSTQRLTPEEVFRQCKECVVVMCTLAKSGRVIYASGVVLDPSGIVVTNYHVMDKNAALVDVIGVMTADGKVYPVQEVLAADRPNDVAVIRIAARGLRAAALSRGQTVGAPVTVIAHPAEQFYTLTHGHVSRYSTWVNCGRQMVTMTITADFTKGSSGGPIFAASGAVAGIVASVKDLGGGMVVKQCVPAQSIRALLSEGSP